MENQCDSLILALMYGIEERSQGKSSGGLTYKSAERTAAEKVLTEQYPGIDAKGDLTYYGVACREIGFWDGFRLATQIMAEATASPFGHRVSL